MYRILTVCTGNICRSPTAAYLLRDALEEAGREDVHVDSAGISDEEEGHPIDPRARTVLLRQGIDPSAHRARQVRPEDFAEHDLLLALDLNHLRALRRMAPDQASRNKIRLMRSFDPAAAGLPEDEQGIYDPWYGGPEDFEETFGMIHDAVPGVLEALPPATDQPGHGAEDPAGTREGRA